MGGSALSPNAIQYHPEDIRQQVAAQSGCWDPISDANAARFDLAPCLRKLSLQQLMETSSISVPHYLPSFAPFADGSSMTSSNSAATKGQFEPRLILRDLSRMKAEAFFECDLLVNKSFNICYCS